MNKLSEWQTQCTTTVYSPHGSDTGRAKRQYGTPVTDGISVRTVVDFIANAAVGATIYNDPYT